MSTRETRTQQITFQGSHLPRIPWRIVAAAAIVAVIWIATITVVVMVDHDLVSVALALAITGSLGVVAWACTICNGIVVAARHQLLQVQLNTLFTAVDENHATLQRISAKLDRDDWERYAEAVTGSSVAEVGTGDRVVPINRAKVRR